MWLRRRRVPRNWRLLQFVGRLLGDTGQDEEDWLPWVETRLGLTEEEVRLILAAFGARHGDGGMRLATPVDL